MTGTCWSVLMRTAELLGLSMRVTLVVVAMLCGSGPVVAEELPEGAVRATFEAKFPGVTIKQLSPIEIPGWYLVETDGAALEASILYVHESGRYVFSGGLFDLASGRNLTREYLRRKQQEVLSGLDLSKVILLKPQAEAQREPALRPIVVFDDPDCPFCRKFHPEVKKIVQAGVPVAVVLYPLVRPHPDAYRKSVAIWCAEDRAAMLDHALAGQPVPSPEQPCAHPIDENLKLGHDLHVSSTPSIFLPNGTLVLGHRSAEEILGQVRPNLGLSVGQ